MTALGGVVNGAVNSSNRLIRRHTTYSGITPNTPNDMSEEADEAGEPFAAGVPWASVRSYSSAAVRGSHEGVCGPADARVHQRAVPGAPPHRAIDATSPRPGATRGGIDLPPPNEPAAVSRSFSPTTSSRA